MTRDSLSPLALDRSMQIESAGSVWYASLGSNTTGPGNGNIVQIVGSAYPTSPQISFAHFGVEPQ